MKRQNSFLLIKVQKEILTIKGSMIIDIGEVPLGDLFCHGDPS